MTAQLNKKPLCRIDAVDADGGDATVLLYQHEDDFSLVVTAKNGGDVDVHLPKKDLATLYQKIGDILK